MRIQQWDEAGHKPPTLFPKHMQAGCPGSSKNPTEEKKTLDADCKRREAAMTPQEWQQVNRQLFRYADLAGDAKECHNAVGEFQRRQKRANDPTDKLYRTREGHKANIRLDMEQRGRQIP